MTLITCLVAAALPMSVEAQDAESYYANEGKNFVHDPLFGEYLHDIGGFIPFSRYTGNTNHGWGAAWANQGVNFQNLMYAEHLNLYQQDLAYNLVFGISLPLDESGPNVVREPNMPFGAPAWWTDPVNPTLSYLRVWHYRINGAYVTIVRRRNPPTLASGEKHHILIQNEARHFSHFTADYSTFVSDSEFLANEPLKLNWPWPFDAANNPHLFPNEQALERGDVLVRVREQYSADVWSALQRSQEAEFFVRNHFWPQEFPDDPGKTFLYGESWGGIMSHVMAVLQPEIYAGAMSAGPNDYGYFMKQGDFMRLFDFTNGAFGDTQISQMRIHSDVEQMAFPLTADLLGSRFDNPTIKEPWDVAMFSMAHRGPQTLQVPIVGGLVASEDTPFNPEWELSETAGLFDPVLLRNLDHGGLSAVMPGLHEYFIFQGTEWDDLINHPNVGPVANGPEMVPSTPYPPNDGLPVPDQVFPDPYSHTLRPDTTTTSPSTFLTSWDLDAGNAAVETLGNGVWPGQYDSMIVDDLDDDGVTEVAFGNLDGFFHVLEYDASTHLLEDEYKSSYKGFGLFGMTRQKAGSRKVWLSDGRGHIHTVQKTSADTYQESTQPFAAPDSGDPTNPLHEGPVDLMYRGNFDPGTAGKEILVMDMALDWILYAENGAVIATMKRPLSAIGPGRGAMMNLDGVTGQELLLPALDGSLWSIRYAGGQLGIQRELTTDPLLAMTRVVVANFNGTTPASHILVFGRNSDGNVIRLYEHQAGAWVLAGHTVTDANLNAPAFAWITPPAAGPQAVFVVAGAKTIARHEVNVQGLFNTAQKFLTTRSPVASLGRLDANHIAVAEADGRIFVRNAGDLEPTLKADATPDWNANVPPGATAEGWHSNRSFGHVSSCDFVDDPSSGTRELLFAELSRPHHLIGMSPRYRVAALDVSVPAAPTINPVVLSAKPPPGLGGHPRTRTFVYEDLDGDGAREEYYLSETGTVFQDGDSVRSFSTTSFDQSFLPNPRGLGGFVFEAVNAAQADYAILNGFNIPIESKYYSDPSRPGSWYYPKVGSNFLSGQVGNGRQGIYAPYFGTSMAHGEFLDSESGVLSECVVAGTGGGYVYVLSPGTQSGDDVPSTLRYASDDLGWKVVGLDVANVLPDAEPEILVGTWIDDGSYLDWRNGDTAKNRGHLYLLDPQANGTFQVTDISGSDLGAGVFCVKADDIDNDGEFEIWCADATGRIYLYEKDTAGQYQLAFRSEPQGFFLGIWNNLFPIKDSSGVTTSLLAVSPGYVHGFHVDVTQL